MDGSRDPLNFWALKVNCSNMVTDTDFTSDKHVPRVSPDMTLKFFYENGTWPGSRDPLIFLSLNAVCSNMVKGTDI